ncbi:MAG: YkgJ family cysteine cluster protein [Actinobacteria bacterium]|nr:YkgJ family cysteine cluster protein [Actinomycetota bacterium]
MIEGVSHSEHSTRLILRYFQGNMRASQEYSIGPHGTGSTKIAENELLHLRKILDSLGNQCIECGICCMFTYGYVLTSLEYDLIKKGYKDISIKVDPSGMSYVATGLHGCKYLQNDDSVYLNAKKYTLQMVEGMRFSQNQVSESKCDIYEERPIICRAYPHWPFEEKCSIDIIFSSTPDKQKLMLCSLYYKYISTYRSEMLNSHGKIDEDFVPIKSKYIVKLREAAYSNALRGLKLLHHFWSPWAYIEVISPSAADLAVLKMCDGTNSIGDVSRKIKISREETTDIVKFYIAHDMLVPPTGISFIPII